MPFVEFEQTFVIQSLLNFNDGIYFPNHTDKRIKPIDVEKFDFESFSTFVFGEKVGQNEDDDVVYYRGEVQTFEDSRHQFLLQIIYRNCVVFEPERFMFVMNENLESPHREHNLLPKFDFVMHVCLMIKLEL